MAKRKNYYISKTDKGWQGKAEGASRASATSSTKAEIIKRMSEIASNHGNASVKIKKTDGKFQEERTYPKNSDPHPPKG